MPVPVPDYLVDPFVLEDEEEERRQRRNGQVRKVKEWPESVPEHVRERVERVQAIEYGEVITEFDAFVSRLTTAKDGGVFLNLGVEFADKDKVWLISDWQGVKVHVEVRRHER